MNHGGLIVPINKTKSYGDRTLRYTVPTCSEMLAFDLLIAVHYFSIVCFRLAFLQIWLVILIVANHIELNASRKHTIDASVLFTLWKPLHCSDTVKCKKRNFFLTKRVLFWINGWNLAAGNTKTLIWTRSRLMLKISMLPKTIVDSGFAVVHYRFRKHTNFQH